MAGLTPATSEYTETSSDSDSPLPRPWMRSVVDHGQLRSGQLRVALGGGEALVAEQFLNRAQVGAFFQQMRAEGVAQRVRMNVGREAAQNGDALDDAADAARGQPRLAAGLAQPAQLQIEKERRSRVALLPPPAAASRAARSAR